MSAFNDADYSGLETDVSVVGPDLSLQPDMSTDESAVDLNDQSSSICDAPTDTQINKGITRRQILIKM